MAIKAKMEIFLPATFDAGPNGYHRGAIIMVHGLPTTTGSTEPVRVNLAYGVSPRKYITAASAIYAAQGRSIEWDLPSDEYGMDNPVIMVKHKEKTVAYALRSRLFSFIPSLKRIRW